MEHQHLLQPRHSHRPSRASALVIDISDNASRFSPSVGGRSLRAGRVCPSRKRMAHERADVPPLVDATRLGQFSSGWWSSAMTPRSNGGWQVCRAPWGCGPRAGSRAGACARCAGHAHPPRQRPSLAASPRRETNPLSHSEASAAEPPITPPRPLSEHGRLGNTAPHTKGHRRPFQNLEGTRMLSAVQATRETIDQLMLLIIALGGLIALTLVITHLTIGTYRALFPTGRTPRSHRRARTGSSTCNNRSARTTRRPSPRNIVVGPAASGPNFPSPTHRRTDTPHRPAAATRSPRTPPA